MLPYADKIFSGQLVQANGAEIVRVPAILMGQPRPCTDGTGEIAGRAPGQEIGQIEKLPGAIVDLTMVFFQPQQLGRLHFGRYFPANVVQHRMMGGVDALRLVCRTVIHPDDDIVFRFTVRADRQRFAIVVQHHQRAGGVKPDAGNALRSRPGARQRLADAAANGLPDLGAGLLHAASAAVHGGNFLRRVGKQPAAEIENACANAAGADVYADNGFWCTLHPCGP